MNARKSLVVAAFVVLLGNVVYAGGHRCGYRRPVCPVRHSCGTDITVLPQLPTSPPSTPTPPSVPPAPIVCTCKDEVAELKVMLEKILEKMPPDNSADIQKILTRVNQGATSSEISAIATSIANLQTGIDANSSAIAALTKIAVQINLTVNPPKPVIIQPIYLSWEKLRSRFREEGIDLDGLHSKCEKAYTSWYRLCHKLDKSEVKLTHSQVENLIVRMKAGETLVFVDTDVCLEQHASMLKKRRPWKAKCPYTDSQGGQGVVLTTVTKEKPGMRGLTVAILVDPPPEGTTETLEGFIVEYYLTYTLVYQCGQ